MSDNSQHVLNKFKQLGGAEHIATVVNIREIIKICKEQNPKRILELGGGIGALSYAMLLNSQAHIDIYEDNKFCEEKLNENLKEFRGRYTIIPCYRILPPESEYDLMIVDGGNKESFHPEWFYIHYLKQIKAIYIEGYRRSQYAWISRALFNCYVYRTIKIPGEEIDGKFRKGGTYITCHLSTSFFVRACSYLYGRLTEDLLLDRTLKFLKRKIFE